MSLPTSSEKRFFAGIDLVRPLAAFGVICFHLAYAFEVDLSPQIQRWLRLRDFSLPFFILVSVFLLSRSFLQEGSKPAPFRALKKRFHVLALPFLFWHAVYSAIFLGVCRHLLGMPVRARVLSEHLTGFEHLWFLQFTFLASCLVIGMMWLLPRKEERHWLYGTFALCLGLGLLSLRPTLRPLLDERLAYVQSWVHLIPLGVALAFFYAARERWFCWSKLGPFAVGLALGGFVLCWTLGARPLVARTLVGVGVVLVALLPWPQRWAKRIRPISQYCYGIYVIHLLVLLAFREVLRRGGISDAVAQSPWFIILGSLACFAGSYLGVRLIGRALAAVGWEVLMPGTSPLRRRALLTPSPRHLLKSTELVGSQQSPSTVNPSSMRT